jgi:arsenite-transporting ATPase
MKVRVILYMGKGGVGKTSVAAASALRSAQLGHRTIILSTDSAHSLSDCFDIELGSEPRPIAPNLWGQEPEVSQAVDMHWGTLRDWFSALLAWRGIDEIAADDMAIFPGMEELADLLYITDYSRSGQYDLIIVDCAPTGETLRLLSFPEILRWWMNRIFPIQRKAASLAMPLLKRVTDIPLPENEVFDSIEDLFYELEQMRALLNDQEQTSVRLVVNAEKMVIKEAQRTFSCLNLYGYSTDLVICNRLIPDKVKDRYFTYWKENQSQYFKMIEEGFAPVPIITVPLLEGEVVGIPMLETMADALHGDDDPARLFLKGQVQSFRKEGEHYFLTITLPFTEKGDISLTQSSDELVIHVGNFKRNIVLPHALISMDASEAKFESGKLKIRFQQRQQGGGKDD